MHLLYEYETITNENLISAIQKDENLQKYFSSRWGKIQAKNYCGLLPNPPNTTKIKLYLTPWKFESGQLI